MYVVGGEMMGKVVKIVKKSQKNCGKAKIKIPTYFLTLLIILSNLAANSGLA
jgi:hypothetical protein